MPCVTSTIGLPDKKGILSLVLLLLLEQPLAWLASSLGPGVPRWRRKEC